MIRSVKRKSTSLGQMGKYPFADKPGKLVAFSHDYLAASPDPTATIAVIDFEVEEVSCVMLQIVNLMKSKSGCRWRCHLEFSVMLRGFTNVGEKPSQFVNKWS